MPLPVWCHVPSRNVSVIGPMFLGGGGGSVWKWSLSRRGSLFEWGVYVQGLSVQGVLCSGVSVQRGLCPGSLSARPPGQRPVLYGEGRAVRILLECILILGQKLVICDYIPL